MSPVGVARAAWAVLAWNVAVILWGAYVRATGSGAGCGSHWPVCNGEVIPRDPSVETLIELTHRLTSGVALLAVVALVWVSRRAFPRGHLARKGAGWSLFFILVEALLGAGLVVFEYVAGDTRPARALVVALHLVNTLILLGWLTLTGWWAGGGGRPRLRGGGLLSALLPLSLGAMLLLGASGAVTALGDTLFPVSSLREGLAQDLSPTAHLFIRLRVLHPVIAVGSGALMLVTALAAALTRPGWRVRGLALGLILAFTVQLGVGVINLALLAPIPLQLLHLFLADAVWILLVLLCAASLSKPL